MNVRILIASLLFATALALSSPAPSLAANSANGMSMPTSLPTSPGPQDAAAIERAATPDFGTAWSVFNHRASGVFILVWGLTALIVGLQWPKRTWFRFVPPIVLLGLVEFLFLRNDPKVWPTGPIGFWAAWQSPEVFQHRMFVLLLLAIAVVELLRAGDRLPALAYKFAIPALAVVGAVLLLLHQHGGPAEQQAMQQMSDPAMANDPSMKAMTASMALIKHEHLVFALIGVGFAASKLGADIGWIKGRLGACLWPLFAVALGVYMLGYVE